MTKLIAKLKTARGAYKIDVAGKLTLAHAERQLAKGDTLRSGDLATGADGRVYEVVAAPEKLLHIECPAAKEAATVGYLLGNAHVPVQIGKGFIRVLHNLELAGFIAKLGLASSEVEAPFEPDLAPPAHHPHHDDHHHHHDHDGGHDHHH